jgi:hypothetical protein
MAFGNILNLLSIPAYCDLSQRDLGVRRNRPWVWDAAHAALLDRY